MAQLRFYLDSTVACALDGGNAFLYIVYSTETHVYVCTTYGTRAPLHDMQCGNLQDVTVPVFSFFADCARFPNCVVAPPLQVHSTVACGAVRHGAECFNYYFPQEMDDEFLVIWDRSHHKMVFYIMAHH